MNNIGTIVSLEPVPEVHALLQRNIERNVPLASRGPGGPLSVSLLNFAGGDEDGREIEFMFYRRAAGWSSMNPSDGEASLLHGPGQTSGGTVPTSRPATFCISAVAFIPTAQVVRNVVAYAARRAQLLSEVLPRPVAAWVQAAMETIVSPVSAKQGQGGPAATGLAAAIGAALAWVFRAAVAAFASLLMGGSVRLRCQVLPPSSPPVALAALRDDALLCAALTRVRARSSHAAHDGVGAPEAA